MTMDESNVIRIREARDRLNKSRTDAKSKEADLLKIYNSILTESGVDVRNMIVPGKCKCPSGPIGTCVYNYFEDPCHEDCIFCHESEERESNG